MSHTQIGLCVWVYVCMCVCVYLVVHAQTHHTYTTHTLIIVRACVYVCVCACGCVGACVRVGVRVCVGVFVCVLLSNIYIIYKNASARFCQHCPHNYLFTAIILFHCLKLS